MNQKYITTSELSELLNLKPNTIACWRTRRESPFKWAKIGRRILYDRAEVMAYIDKQKRDRVQSDETNTTPHGE